MYNVVFENPVAKSYRGWKSLASSRNTMKSQTIQLSMKYFQNTISN